MICETIKKYENTISKRNKKNIGWYLYGSKKIFLFTIRFVCGFELKPIYFLFKKCTRTQEKHARKKRNMYGFCFQVQINLFFKKMLSIVVWKTFGQWDL